MERPGSHFGLGVGTGILACAVAGLALWEPRAPGGAGEESGIPASGKRPAAAVEAEPPLQVAAASEERAGHYVCDLEARVLSLDVRDVPLARVLAALSEHCGVPFESLGALSLEHRITQRFERLPIVQAVQRLLEGFNKVLLYDSRTRLAGVLLLSAAPAQALREVRQELRADARGAVRRAVGRDDAVRTEALVEALREPGMEGQRQLAVESVIRDLDEQDVEAYARALEMLQQLGAGSAEQVLIQRLQSAAGQGDPTAQQRAVMAAWGLGVIGSGEAVGPLQQTLQESGPDLRRASADSLQQIRQRQEGQDPVGRPPPPLFDDQRL